MGRKHFNCRDRVDLVFCIKYPFLNKTTDELHFAIFHMHKHKDVNVDSVIIKIAQEKWRRLVFVNSTSSQKLAVNCRNIN